MLYMWDEVGLTKLKGKDKKMENQLTPLKLFFYVELKKTLFHFLSFLMKKKKIKKLTKKEMTAKNMKEMCNAWFGGHFNYTH